MRQPLAALGTSGIVPYFDVRHLLPPNVRVKFPAKYLERLSAEQAENDAVEAAAPAQVVGGDGEHDRGAAFDGKPEDAAADGWKSDAFQRVLLCDFQAAGGGAAQFFVFVAFAHARADCVDDMLRPQPASGREHGAANRAPADLIAFSLNGRTPLAANRAGDTGAEDQCGVRGIDYCVDSLFRDVPLHQFQGAIVDRDLHASHHLRKSDVSVAPANE